MVIQKKALNNIESSTYGELDAVYDFLDMYACDDVKEKAKGRSDPKEAWPSESSNVESDIMQGLFDISEECNRSKGINHKSNEERDSSSRESESGAPKTPENILSNISKCDVVHVQHHLENVQVPRDDIVSEQSLESGIEYYYNEKFVEKAIESEIKEKPKVDIPEKMPVKYTQKQYQINECSQETGSISGFSMFDIYVNSDNARTLETLRKRNCDDQQSFAHPVVQECETESSSRIIYDFESEKESRCAVFETMNMTENSNVSLQKTGGLSIQKSKTTSERKTSITAINMPTANKSKPKNECFVFGSEKVVGYSLKKPSQLRSNNNSTRKNVHDLGYVSTSPNSGVKPKIRINRQIKVENEPENYLESPNMRNPVINVLEVIKYQRSLNDGKEQRISNTFFVGNPPAIMNIKDAVTQLDFTEKEIYDNLYIRRSCRGCSSIYAKLSENYLRCYNEEKIKTTDAPDGIDRFPCFENQEYCYVETNRIDIKQARLYVISGSFCLTNLFFCCYGVDASKSGLRDITNCEMSGMCRSENEYSIFIRRGQDNEVIVVKTLDFVLFYQGEYHHFHCMNEANFSKWILAIQARRKEKVSRYGG